MATTTTDKPATTSGDGSATSSELDKQKEKMLKVPEVNAEDVKKVYEDPRFDLPTTRIRTAEDAYMAYLREEIDESELRAVVSVYGNPKFSSLKNNLERPDNAFVRTVPEDLYDDPSLAVTSVEDRLKLVEAREKDAEKGRQQELEAEKKSS